MKLAITYSSIVLLSLLLIFGELHVGAQQPERPPGVDECWDTANLLRKRNGKVARFSAKEMKAMAINRVVPKYPKACSCSGTVIIAVKVNAEGKVECARKISGHPIFEAALMEAAKQWSFKPLKKDGKPVAFVGLLAFTFKSSGEVSLG